MTRDAERALLAEYLDSCKMVSATFAETADLVAHLLPVTIETVDMAKGIDKISMLAFLKSYEQFEDVLQKTIKTIIQIMEFGKVERLTGVDIANRGASLGIIANPDPWSDAVRVRNALAHEYPLRPDKRMAQVNSAWAMRATLNETWGAIQRFIVREKLQ